MDLGKAKPQRPTMTAASKISDHDPTLRNIFHKHVSIFAHNRNEMFI